MKYFIYCTVLYIHSLHNTVTVCIYIPKSSHHTECVSYSFHEHDYAMETFFVVYLQKSMKCMQCILQYIIVSILLAYLNFISIPLLLYVHPLSSCGLHSLLYFLAHLYLFYLVPSTVYYLSPIAFYATGVEMQWLNHSHLYCLN
jgi:hypothetical protein